MPQTKTLPSCESASRRAPLARLKAIASEQRALAATDPALRQDWEELAIEWHLLANLSAASSASASPPDRGEVDHYIDKLAGAIDDVTRRD